MSPGKNSSPRGPGPGTQVHVHTHLTHALTCPSPYQERFCKMEEPTRRHKGALRRRPRKGKRSRNSRASTVCYNRAQGSSPPSHSQLASGPGPRPYPDFTGQEAKAQRQSLVREQAASKERRGTEPGLYHPKAIVLPTTHSQKTPNTHGQGG